MNQRLSDYRLFIKEFRRTFHHTGAMLPSGAPLARAITGPLARCPQHRRRLLEVGPGTGAVTNRIIDLLRPDDHLTLVEINQRFVERLRARFEDDPRWRKVADQVTIQHLGLLEFDPAEPFDFIISGMPLNNFDVDLATQLVEKLYTLVKPTGTISFFEYFAIRRMKALVSPRAERVRLSAIEALLKGRIKQDSLGSNLVLANAPPAWAHHLRPKNGQAP